MEVVPGGPSAQHGRQHSPHSVESRLQNQRRMQPTSKAASVPAPPYSRSVIRTRMLETSLCCGRHHRVPGPKSSNHILMDTFGIRVHSSAVMSYWNRDSSRSSGLVQYSSPFLSPAQINFIARHWPTQDYWFAQPRLEAIRRDGTPLR